jgi:signal transduction histidine kinase
VPLIRQLRWFIRCRWVAGAAIIAGALLDRWWLRALPGAMGILWVGVAVLSYNALLRLELRRIEHREGAPQQRRAALLLVAWVQLLLDFAANAMLVMWTGGLLSPLMRLYVLHMVFASLLLPRRMAYAGAAAAIVIQATALFLAGQLPAEAYAHLVGASQAVVLFLVVFLTNHITRDLRRQHRRLVKQNRRITRMSRLARRQQRALVQHEKMVALGQMAAGISHEIANPLASMDSLLQLVARKPDRMSAETVASLREQVARINRIIQQMKAFAHPDERQQAAQQTRPLNDVVEQALKMLEFDHRVRRVKFERQLSPDAGLVPVFPQALEQVLLNLLINGLDAMDAVAEPRLAIRTEYRAGQCTIEIADNGHGIKPEHLKRLFEPFFTTKPLGKGTGLGLSISYSLVRRLGGDITVWSEPGKGTTFTVRLPAPRGGGGGTPAGGASVAASQDRERRDPPVAISGNDKA